jgi:dTDP-4-amino-4,6-dideoxygalactose transaminase
MRGHIADMDAVMAACEELNLLLVEDCAHALCAAWGGRTIGTFGAAAAFSAQTYKHLNAGEGGFLVLDDGDRAARAILHSGSYMLHGQHLSAPPAETMARWEETTPNFSMRMTALAAALLRPQLHDLPRRAARWNAIHDRIGQGLARSQHLRVPQRSPREAYAATSVQFSLRDCDEHETRAFLARCAARGLPVKWFGAGRQSGFTSAPRHWRYAGEQGRMQQTHAVLAGLCDIRTPLSLNDRDCDLVAEIVREAIETVASARAEAGETGRARAGSRPG